MNAKPAKTRESNNGESIQAAQLGKRPLGGMRPFFQRKKSCPFSGPNAQAIDYKDTRTLSRYVSDFGKIVPSHISGVSTKKQRELARAIKRARMLALLPYNNR